MDLNSVTSTLNNPAVSWIVAAAGWGAAFKTVKGWIASGLAWSQDAKNAKLIKDANALADDLLEKCAAAGHPDLAQAETTLNALVAQLPTPKVNP